MKWIHGRGSRAFFCLRPRDSRFHLEHSSTFVPVGAKAIGHHVFNKRGRNEKGFCWISPSSSSSSSTSFFFFFLSLQIFHLIRMEHPERWLEKRNRTPCPVHIKTIMHAKYVIQFASRKTTHFSYIFIAITFDGRKKEQFLWSNSRIQFDQRCQINPRKERISSLNFCTVNSYCPFYFLEGFDPGFTEGDLIASPWRTH